MKNPIVLAVAFIALLTLVLAAPAQARRAPMSHTHPAISAFQSFL